MPSAAESVRERLEAEPVALLVGADSTGSVTAQRRSGSGWEAGVVDLSVLRGDLVVSAARGALRVEGLSVELGPIEIPTSVLGYPAQLTDVHLELVAPVDVETVWTTDDDASAMAPLKLELSWSLAIDGQSSPLGAPSLPAVPVGFAISGDGASVRVEASAVAAGTVWSWADLVKLEDLNLVLGAATATP